MLIVYKLVQKCMVFEWRLWCKAGRKEMASDRKSRLSPSDLSVSQVGGPQFIWPQLKWIAKNTEDTEKLHSS